MKTRNSNLELFRVLSMLVIVAHHYVVNSGIIHMITMGHEMKMKDAFLLLLGGGGKTGINGFILITGYFMCTSNITLKKFCKLFFEIEFYRIIIYIIFILSGYSKFFLPDFIKAIFPFNNICDGFISTYLVFFLLIPFINILINAMNKRQHRLLILLLVSVFSVLATIPGVMVVFNYVEWFIILYLIASYIRLYPIPIFDNTIFWGTASIVLLVVSGVSVLLFAYFSYPPYFFVADSNKILPLLTGISLFMFFKNIKMPYIKMINVISASTFGVLLIHANSDIMRRWLWKDLLKNISYYNSGGILVVHALLSIVGIYIVCTMVDYVRIHAIEIPFFNRLFKANTYKRQE